MNAIFNNNDLHVKCYKPELALIANICSPIDSSFYFCDFLNSFIRMVDGCALLSFSSFPKTPKTIPKLNASALSKHSKFSYPEWRRF